MASDIFAKIGDIKGESLDSKHAGEIDVQSFSWGATQSGTMAFGGGGGAGKVQFPDFHFTSNTSKASPLLLKACATGEHIKDAQITVRKAGKGQQEFLIIKMNDVLISSYQVAGSSQSESDSVSDQISMAFAKVEYSYYPQKADGSLEAPVTFRFDIKGNKEG
jgi:type VI secretion system secreted protein Hcp